MTDILERLADLNKQATVERSHHYVSSVARDAVEEIKALRLQAAALEGLNADLFRTMREATRGQIKT